MTEETKEFGGCTQPQAATAAGEVKASCKGAGMATLIIDGCPEAKAALGDMIWQGINYMGEEIAEDAKLGDNAAPRINYLCGKIYVAATLYYQIQGLGYEDATERAKQYVEHRKSNAYANK